MQKNKIAAVLVGAISFALASHLTMANPLSNAQKADDKVHRDAAVSQKKVDDYYDQAQNMAVEYAQVADTLESTKAYNDYVAGLIADQQATITSIKKDIKNVNKLRQTVVPLMFKMVDALDHFIALDLPFNLQVRQERVKHLRETLNSADVALAEKYRLILDAYSIEREYGTKMKVQTGQLQLDGKKVLVDFVNFGRVALYAQSLDRKSAWMYNKKIKTWNKLNDSYLRAITKAIRQARGQVAPDMFALPLPVAKAAQE